MNENNEPIKTIEGGRTDCENFSTTVKYQLHMSLV